MFTDANTNEGPHGTPHGNAAIEAALKSIPGAVFMVDTQLRYIAVGGRSAMDVLSVHGLTPQALLGARVADVVAPEHREPTLGFYVAVLAGHTPRFELLRAGRTFEVTGHLLRDLDGQPVAAIAHFHDVTERAVAREELAQERARVIELLTDVQTLIELLPDGLCIVVDERIVYVNDAFARTLGYETKVDLAGVHMRSVVVQRDLATVSDRFDLSLVERHVGTVDVGLVSSAGVVIPLEMSPPRRVSHRGAQACVAVFRDLRERKQLEAAAHARDRLATVGTLAAGVGHEINNPLTFVMSNLEIMADELARSGPLDEAQRRDLANLVNEALEGASRVKKVVRGLRTFARGEREERTRLDVRQVIELSITFAFSQLRHKVHVVRELTDVPEVIADESRLAQVFINLLVNASHAMQDLPYERNVVRVRTYAKDGFVHTEFSDNGPGMSDEVRQRVFEPFFTTKAIGEGSGLGLSIAYNVISALGGELRCDSSPGDGARFTVTLPAATDAAGLSVTPPPGVLRLPRRGRVLVVDDEPLVGSVVRRILAQHDVTVVLSADEALALILGGQVYDCVLCDLMMPGTSGMELHAHVRGVLPEVADRFVFVSGGPTTQEAARFVGALSLPIIEKPFQSDALRAKVGATVAMAEMRRGKP